MKNLLFNRTIIIVLLVVFSSVFARAGATIKRLRNESVEALLKRATNEENLSLVAQYPLKSFSKPGATDIICFYTPMQNGSDAVVKVVLLLCVGNDQYRLVTVDEVGPEAHIAEIASVFLANADKDKNRELVVLYSWPQQHSGVSGVLYSTHIYDDASQISNDTLKPLTEVGEKFGLEFQGTQEGVVERAKFINSCAIRNKLAAMGFRQ